MGSSLEPRHDIRGRKKETGYLLGGTFRVELNRERIIKVLKGVNYPGFNRDIVSFGLVKDIMWKVRR